MKLLPDHIDHYVEALAKAGLSQATIDRKLSSIRKFHEWADQKGYLTPPEPPPPSPEPVIPTPTEPYQTDTIIINPQTAPPPADSGFMEQKPTTHKAQRAVFLALAGATLIVALMLLNRQTQVFRLIWNFAKQPQEQITTLPPPRPSPAPPAGGAIVASPAEPWVVFFKGKVTGAQGQQAPSTGSLQFSLYQEPTEGTPLWTSKVWQLAPNEKNEFVARLGDTSQKDSPIPQDLFFQHEYLYLGVRYAPDGGDPKSAAESAPRMKVSSAAHAADAATLAGHEPSEKAGIGQIPVIDPNGALVLASQTPSLIATTGTFKIEGQAVTLKTASFTNGNITLAPDGEGHINLVTSGSTGNQVNAQNANLASGSLYYGSVGNDATGYNLIELASGSTPVTRFKVDALGNTTVGGNLSVAGTLSLGQLAVAALSSGTTSPITFNSSMLFPTHATVSATGDFTLSPSGILNITSKIQNPGTNNQGRVYIEDTTQIAGHLYTRGIDAEGTVQLNGVTYVRDGLGISRPTTALTDGYKLDVVGNATVSGDLRSGGQIQTGRFASAPSAVGAGGMYFNTGDTSLYLWNGTGWVAIGGGATAGFWQRNAGAVSPLTSADDLLVGASATSSALVKFTGTSGGNSFINTGSFGIGTTSPGATLDVNGNILLAGAGTIDARAAGTLAIGGTTQTGLTLGRSGATTTIAGSSVLVSPLTTNGPVYTSGSNGTLNAEQYLALTRGGTAADLSGVATGGLIYKAASALAGTAALSGILQGNGSSAPTAITGTANYLPKWSSSAPYLTATSLLYDDGTNIGIGTTTPGAVLDVVGSATVSGNLTLYAGNRSIQTTANNGLTIGGSTTGNITLSPLAGASGSFVAPSTHQQVDLGLSANSFRNIYGKTLYQNGNQACDITGNCSAATDIWSQANGALFPKNGTVDLLIGATSTASAKFGFLNVNTGTPTASISGTTTGAATYLTGNGNLATTNAQSLTLGGATTGNIVFGNNIASSLIPSVTSTYDLGSSTNYWNNVYANNIFAPSSGISGYWQRNAGALAPTNITDDLLVGGTATSSALFQVFGNTGTATTAGNLAFSATAPTITTTKMAPLVIGSSTTGPIQLSPKGTTGLFVDGSGNVGVGTTSPGAKLHTVTSGANVNTLIGQGDSNGTSAIQIVIRGNTNTNQQLLIGYNTTSDYASIQPLIQGTGYKNLALNPQGGNVGIGTTSPLAKLDVNGTASVSGALTLYGTPTISSTAMQSLTLGGTTSGNIIVSNNIASHLIPSADNTYDLGSSSNRWRNVYGVTLYQSGNQVCDVTGNCQAATDIWSQANGALFPKNATVDLLVGGTATSSAKFGFINVNSGTPTASISGTTTGVTAYLTGNGTLATTNMAPLTIGSSTTGPLQFYSTSNSLTSGGNLTLAGTVSLPNSNTLTGVSNYLRLSQGVSVGGADTYYLNSSGTGNLNALTLAGNLTLNGNVASNVIPSATGTYDLGSSTRYWNNLYVNNVYAPATGISGYWQRNSGVLAPTNITDDFLVGGTATSSALFQVFGNTGTATTAGNLAFSATAPTITTTKMAPLVIGSSSTGPIQLSPKGTTGLFVDGSGNVGIGTTGPNDKLHIDGGTSKGKYQFNVTGADAILKIYRWAGVTTNYHPWYLATGLGTNGADFGIQTGPQANVGSESVSTVLFIQKNTGNVGIGNTSPLEKLDVTGNATVSGNLTFSGASSTIANRKMQPIQIGDASTGNINFYSTSNSITSGGNLTLAGTISLPNSNTLTGVSNYTQFSNGVSVGGGTTYYVNSSGTANLNAITAAGLITANGGVTVASGQSLTVSGNVASSLIPSATSTYDLGSTTRYWNNLYVNTINAPATGVSGYWQRNNQVLSPANITDDVLIGVTATPSASSTNYFQVFGSGTTAGDASSSGILTLGTNRTTATIGTQRMIPLTIGSSTTGPLQFYSTSNTLTSGGNLTLAGTISLPNSAVLTGDTTYLRSSTGVAFGSNQTYYINSSGTGNLNALTLAGNLTLNGNVASNVIPSANNTYDLGSSANQWRNLYITGNYDGFWQRFNGALSPTNITDDLLVGGTATSSALFQVFGNTGTATTAGNLVFSATAPTITTTKMAPLVIGSSTTGPIQLSPKGTTGLFVDGSGNVGIGTTSPGAKLHTVTSGANVNTLIGQGDSNGTSAIQIVIRGNTNTNQQLLIGYNTTSDYASIQPLIQGTGYKNLALNPQGGNVGIGNTAPLEKLDITGNATVSGNLTFSGAASTIANRKMQPIQIGDSATGNINFYSTSNSLTPAGNLTLAGNLGLATSAVSASNYITAPNFVLNTSGQITTGAWQATAVGTQYGGTGQNWSAVAQGAIPYFSGTGAMTTLAPGTSGYVLTTQGASANPIWTNSTSVGTNYWTLASGALYPSNATVDLLVGGTATSSAKFAFINVATGTPTASVSGNLTLDAAGIIATTKMQQLTIGSATTGPIQLSPKGTTGLFVDATGQVGIGTTAPGTNLEINGQVKITGGSPATNKVLTSDSAGLATWQTITGAGGIGGSGTLNYVAKFTPDGSNIGNSSIFDNGLVGIGTTSPTSPLHVNKGYSDNALAILNQLNSGDILTASASGTTKLKIANNGDLRSVAGASWKPLTDATNALNIANASGAFVTFDTSNARVGIGTTLPSYELQNQNSFGLNQGTPTTGYIGGNLTFNRTDTDAIITGPTNFNLALRRAGTGNILFVDSGGGLVGIGNGSPVGLLDVAGAIKGKALTILNETGDQNILVASASGVTKFQLDRSGDILASGQVQPGSFASNPTQVGSGAIIYRSDLTQLYYYNGSAWTAIGSGTGGSNWRIISGMMTPLNDTLDIGFGGSATSSAKFAFLNVNTGTPTASISGNLALAVPTGSTPANTLNLYNGGSLNIQTSPGGDAGLTSRLFMDKAGNVGIGTTSPFSVLSVVASAYKQLELGTSGASAQSFFNIDGSGNAYWDVNRRTVDGVFGNTSATHDRITMSTGNGAGYIAFSTTNTNNIAAPEVMRISGSGNVGIGNTAPVAKLDVNGEVKGKALTIINQTGNQDIIAASASGTTRFRVSNSGDIVAQRFVDIASCTDNGANCGATPYLIDPAASGIAAVDIAGGVRSGTGVLTSTVADSSTAVGFTLNTSNSFTTQGAKLLSVQTNASEKFYVDKDGNIYAAGTILAGNGAGLLMKNKSGGIVAQKAIVIVDTTNNSSFTTTTTAYSKGMYGVVTGVGLTVSNDVNGDGVCDDGDNCMVAFGGEVNVTIKNTTTVAKGDYVYTSDTAGSAVTSAKLFDGMLGVVTNTSTSGSGYVKIIFKPQTQVTAAASIDKGSKYNEYKLYANNYTGVGEGTNPNTDLNSKGMYFDNLLDNTKTDSANTTVSGPRQVTATTGNPTPASPFRAGLMGGQTMSAATTDNAGNTYLASTTVNKTIYYDRTRDSTPAVLVNLGIDPNWYNGVTLAVATTSAQFSQSDTTYSQTVNPNLSTTYNGSLVQASGTYASNAKTIYVTIKSPTTFDWTDYNGQAATSVTMTPGTAQTLGGTGVSVKFTNTTTYNTGDVFKIASWYVEPSSSTRAAKAAFPERAIIVADNSGVDIIDADTQKLWMRFSTGTNFALGASSNNTPSSVAALNGKLYVATNGSSATGLYTEDFVHDMSFRQNATDWRLSDSNLANRNGTNNYIVINTTNTIVNVTVNDVAVAAGLTGTSPNTYTTFVAAATSGGISLVNEQSRSTVNSSDTSAMVAIALVDNSAVTSASLALYALKNTATTTLNVYYNAQSLAASFATSTTYTNATTPALFASNSTLTSLSVVPGRSTIDGKSNIIYTGSVNGLSVIQEKQGSESSGSVKYYTKDYISEEMIGDIKGAWPFYNNAANTTVNDASKNAATLTSNRNTSLISASSVRGNGYTFVSASSDYLTASSTVTPQAAKSVGFWIKTTTVGTQQFFYDNNAGSSANCGLFAIFDADTTGRVRWTHTYGSVGNTNYNLYTQGSVADGNWHFIVHTWDGTTGTGAAKVYVDGVLNNVATPSSSTTCAPTNNLRIGAVSGATPSNYMNGSLDEVFVTGTVLTASQVSHLYEVGYRALQSHATTLGGGAADKNQQLAGSQTPNNVVKAVGVDYNNQFLYVTSSEGGLNLGGGGVSKIDLDSDTNIFTYTTSSTPKQLDSETSSLAVGYNLEALSSTASGVLAPGYDSNAAATSGNFISKTYTTSETFSQLYIWSQYTLDSSDTSNTVQVWASNDGGSNYYQCNNTNTNANLTPTEYEYFCQLNTPGSSLKLKYIFARGSTKTNTYLTRYGVAWIGSDVVGGAPGGNGLYTNSNASVANGSYLEVAHNQGSNDIVTNGWVWQNSQWKDVATATESGVISNSGSVANNGALTVTHNQQTNDLLMTAWVQDADGKYRQASMSAEFNDFSARVYNNANETINNNTNTALTFNTENFDTDTMHDTSSNTSRITINHAGKYLLTANVNWGANATGYRQTRFFVNGIASGPVLGGVVTSVNDGAVNTLQEVSTVYDFAAGDYVEVVVTQNSGGNLNVTSTTGNGGTYSPVFSARYLGPSSAPYVVTQEDKNTVKLWNLSGSTQTMRLDVSTQAYQIRQIDSNTVRLYNYSGSTQNLRLDVITGVFNRNSGTVSLAPLAADVDANSNLNSIWVNKTGSWGNLIKLQASGTDMFGVDSVGHATIAATLKIGAGSTLIDHNSITWSGGSKIRDNGGKLELQAGGTGTGSTGNGSIYFLDSSGNTQGRFETINKFGTGADGPATISSAKNINTGILADSGRSTYADGIAYRVVAPADVATTVTRFSGSDTLSNGIAAGDELLLINLQGASGDTADVGNYEFMRVASVTASTITFTTNITKSFDGTTASNQKVVVQRVPNYSNVTLSGSGSITASAWDGLTTTPTGGAGYLTGIVAFRASGTVSVATGTSITVAALGYRGGAGAGNNATATQGESTKGTGAASTAANNGGGGGGRNTNCTPGDIGGGGGGAYAATGTSGGTFGCGVTGGTGGTSYGSSTLSTMFFGSGGGGASHQSGSIVAGSNGGGIIFIAGNTITVTSTGAISAKSGNGGADAGVGAGGSIYIKGGTITLGSSLVTAAAGSTGGTVPGAGSVGIIQVEYTTSLSGTTTPTASTLLANSYGTLYTGSTNTAAADLAEYYVSGDKTLAAGDVVTISDTKVLDDNNTELTNKGVLRKAALPYDSKMIGIISTKPGLVLGSVDGDTNQADQRQLALAGRVPVKIDPDSPPISVGDFLTSSTKPGYAIKATRAGYVVAKALENWTSCANQVPSSSANQICGAPQIEAFVHLGYFAGELTQEGFLEDGHQKTTLSGGSLTDTHTSVLEPSPSDGSVSSTSGDVKSGVDVRGVAPLQPGLTDLAPHWRTPTPDTIIASASAWLKENWDALSKQNVDIVKSLWTKTTLLTADTIIVGGQSLKDYIQDVVSKGLALRGLQGEALRKFDVISPVASDSAGISVELGEGQTFGIYNKEGSPAALFDSVGNLGILGNLRVEKDASIAGTLYADRIVTRFGDFDLVRTATLAATTITNITNVTNVYEATPSSIIPNTDTLHLTPDATSSALLALLKADTGINASTYQRINDAVDATDAVTLSSNLSVLGDTTLGRTSIAGSLLVDGSVRVTASGIETIGDTLYVQKNKFANFDVMAGSLVVNTLGNVMIKGDLAVGGNLTVGGRLSANTISPLADDVVIDLSSRGNATSSAVIPAQAGIQTGSPIGVGDDSQRVTFGRFLIRGAGGTIAASIDAAGSAQFAGDVVASGSGTFNKLFIAGAGSGLAGSEGLTPSASASATPSPNATIGTGTLPNGQLSVTIATTKVTTNSFIYITPIGSTNNRVLYVKSKTAGSGFEVAVDQPLPNDVQFNWWIVN